MTFEDKASAYTSFEVKYAAWSAQQVQEPPEYVRQCLEIFWECNEYTRGDFLNTLYWDDVKHKLVPKGRLN